MGHRRRFVRKGAGGATALERVRAARDRAASYLEASARAGATPTPFFVVIPGALMTPNFNRDHRDNAQARKSFLDVPDDALLQILLCMSYPRCAVLAATNKRLLALFKSKPLAGRRGRPGARGTSRSRRCGTTRYITRYRREREAITTNMDSTRAPKKNSLLSPRNFRTRSRSDTSRPT